MTMEPDYKDDLALAGEVKKGNEKAFDYLFRTRYARMCRLAVTFINDKVVAEDIVQEIFSTVWQHAHRVNERRSIDGYLFTSVRNACLNHLRDARHHVSLDALLQEATPPEAAPDTDDPRLTRLWQVIEALPLQCKVIFKLVAIEEMKYHEVAERMELSVNTVKTQIKIAYKTLRQKMEIY
jgi:RNA polymerase sigma-70 factor (ECF subfamily)